MRIALVDPSRTTRLIVTRLLEARGHEAIPFADGAEALRCMKFDLGIEALITSAELPTMSGVELCWEARAGDRSLPTSQCSGARLGHCLGHRQLQVHQ